MFPATVAASRTSERRNVPSPVRERGHGEVVEIADTAAGHRASPGEAAAGRPPPGMLRRGETLAPLAAVAEPWRQLAGRAIEPNGYYLPDWELAVNASARGRTRAAA